MADADQAPIFDAGPSAEGPALPAPFLRRLHINNFKSFAGEHSIPLTPLTLIYGPNAAGKSTVIQSPLLMDESLNMLAGLFEEQPWRERNAKFSRLVSRHDESVTLELGVDFGLRSWSDMLGRAVLSLSRSEHDQDGMLVALTMGVEGQGSIKMILQSSYEEIPGWGGWAYHFLPSGFDSGGDGLLNYLIETGHLLFPRLAAYETERRHDHELMATPDGRIEVRPERRSQFLPRAHVVRDVDGAIEDLPYVNRALETLFHRLTVTLGSTFHLGPHRGVPGDPYRYRQESFMPWHLSDGDLDDSALNDWLVRLDVPYRVRRVTIEEEDPAYASYLSEIDRTADWSDGIPQPADTSGWALVDLRTDVSVSLDQVGYGVSQLLPIIDVSTRDSAQVICIEQPELHLHPRLQANLADLFVDSVLRGNQVIAETHSENILLRLGRLIRQGKINPAIVSILYVDNRDAEGASVRRLRLSRQGSLLDPWPAGFFDDSLDDILGGW